MDVGSVDADPLTMLLAMLLVMIATVLHLAARRKWSRRLRELEVDLARTGAKLDREALILRSEPHITISWDRPDVEPTIEGDAGLIVG